MSEFNVAHFFDPNNWLQNSSLADEHGLLKANRFMCLINSPLNNNDWLEWQVLSVNTPNFNFEMGNMEINGQSRYYVKTRSDNTLTVTFLESADLSVRTFFYDWMNFGFNQETGKRMYMDEFKASDFKVVALDWKGDGIRCDTFRDVFPTAINSLDYDLTSENSFLKIEVTFQFRFHVIEKLKQGDLKHKSTKTK